jgi:hypothetical protein
MTLREDGCSSDVGVLARVAEPLCAPITSVLEGLRLRIEFVPSQGAFAERIETAYPDIVLMDLDLVARPGELARFAWSLRRQTKIVAVTAWWSDREPLEEFDLTLHKPPRRDEWFPAMARLLASMAARS